mmetsp:Transcript_1511/g.5894  ORF Transcript_1511/g.5894 Transcript_1511/m.5894 type:complete len:260 (-) Transcript_1511:295-1074(-)
MGVEWLGTGTASSSPLPWSVPRRCRFSSKLAMPPRASAVALRFWYSRRRKAFSASASSTRSSSRSIVCLRCVLTRCARDPSMAWRARSVRLALMALRFAWRCSSRLFRAACSACRRSSMAFSLCQIISAVNFFRCMLSIRALGLAAVCRTVSSKNTLRRESYPARTLFCTCASIIVAEGTVSTAISLAMRPVRLLRTTLASSPSVADLMLYVRRAATPLTSAIILLAMRESTLMPMVAREACRREKLLIIASGVRLFTN